LEMIKNILYPISVFYTHESGSAFFEIAWSGPGVPANTVLSGDNLFFKRHIINSPFEVNIFPGVVEASTSSASGSGLSECTTLSNCSFVIQSRDRSGNEMFNYGSQDWNITLFGVADWAGYEQNQRQINDYNHTGVEHLSYDSVSLGWTFVSNATVLDGSRSIYFPSSAVSILSRGNTISIAGQVYLIADIGSFDVSHATLDRPYRGEKFFCY